MAKFKAILKSIGARLNNTGSVLALMGIIINILIQFGVKLDVEWINDTVNAICSLFIFFGVLNSPIESTKAYIPGIQDKLVDKK